MVYLHENQEESSRLLEEDIPYETALFKKRGISHIEVRTELAQV